MYPKIKESSGPAPADHLIATSQFEPRVPRPPDLPHSVLADARGQLTGGPGDPPRGALNECPTFGMASSVRAWRGQVITALHLVWKIWDSIETPFTVARS